jgi:hypothetical protein
VTSGPEDGLRMREGGRTENVAVAKSPSGLPVARIVYKPAGTLATSNEPIMMPPEIAQEGEATGLPDNVQLVSLDENPEPHNWTSGLGNTDDHTWAELGLSMRGFRLTANSRSPTLLVRMLLFG